jgi:hypothetical protein
MNSLDKAPNSDFKRVRERLGTSSIMSVISTHLQFLPIHYITDQVQRSQNFLLFPSFHRYVPQNMGSKSKNKTLPHVSMGCYCCCCGCLPVTDSPANSPDTCTPTGGNHPEVSPSFPSALILEYLSPPQPQFIISMLTLTCVCVCVCVCITH